MSAFVAVDELIDVLDARTLEILEHRRDSPGIRRRGWLVRRALVAADVAGLSAAFLVAQEVYAVRLHDAGAFSRFTEFVTFALSIPFWILGAKIYGLYARDEERTDHSTADDFAGIFHLVTVCTFLLYSFSRATHWFNPEFGKLLIFWMLGILGTFTLRSVARTYCRRQIHYLQNTVIVGAGNVGQSVARKLLKHPEYGINLVGFLDAQPMERASDLGHLTILGDIDDASRIVELLDVERVIVAFSNEGHHDVLRAVHMFRKSHVQVDIVPRLFDSLGPSAAIHTIEGIPLISLPPSALPASSMVVKRILDTAVAGLALVLLSPVLALIAVLVRCDSPGPIFYRHERAGRHGKTFGLFKFRTMSAEYCRGERYGGATAEAEFSRLMSRPEVRAEFERTYKLAEDPRVTRIGRFLRRTSLDELPQLVNVLLGDMSLVGPRPLTGDELARYYGDASATLLRLRPGVTGYWQINGRSDLDYQDRVRLDLAYVGGWTLGLDLMILARTLRVIASRQGAS